jgi:hypothetical protein
MSEQYLISEEQLTEWESGNMCWSEERILHRVIRSRLLSEHDEQVKREAREEVLDSVRDRCAEKMSDHNPTITGVMLSYILSDLRSEVKKS